MQLHQSVRTCGHGQRRPPRKVGTKTDTKRTLRHVRAVFLRFSTWKTLENASSVGKIRELAWVLWMVMPTCGKSVATFDGVGKKTVVGNPLPGRPTSSWLHWGYVIACMQLHQSVRTCGHGQRRPPRKVGTKTDTKRTLRHVRAVFLRFWTWKTLENAWSVGKIHELAWMLWMVMATCGKSVARFDGVEKKP